MARAVVAAELTWYCVRGGNTAEVADASANVETFAEKAPTDSEAVAKANTVGVPSAGIAHLDMAASEAVCEVEPSAQETEVRGVAKAATMLANQNKQ